MNQIVIAFDKEPDTLNPYATHVLAAKEIDVVEGFHVTNDKMEYIPREVQRVPTLSNAGLTLTAGKMTVTWRLKPGLKWSDGEPVTSCTIITTDANELVAPIHERMPVIIPKRQYQSWLNPELQDVVKLVSLLSPLPARQMQAYEVSRLVNAPANNAPECIAPVAEA